MKYEHWNSADALPPVDCPLVILYQPEPEHRPSDWPFRVWHKERAVHAVRTGFLDDKTRDMEYRLTDGGTISGRFRWTYP